MFKNLDKRIQRDIQSTVDARLKLTEELTGGRMKVRPKYPFKLITPYNLSLYYIAFIFSPHQLK